MFFVYFATLGISYLLQHQIFTIFAYLSLGLETILIFFSASKVLLFPLSLVFLVQMGILAFNLFSLLTAFDNSNHSFLKGKFSFLGFCKTIFPHCNPTIFCPSTQSPLPISQMQMFQNKDCIFSSLLHSDYTLSSEDFI